MTLLEEARQLVDKMTVEEVASQLKYDAPAIERLGIPAYNWWNEALHGVARAGVATVFPQAVGMAATFDDELLNEVAQVIATEARAKYNEQFEEGDHDIYKGLTMWSPNINIFRDPRWGRGHETYGEDPYLTERLGVSFIKGLQGAENYPECDSLKVAACAKHFAVHSGPEADRHFFNAIANPKDMTETYLPQFEAAVKEGHVESVMGAYNRTNDEPCCASTTLMKDTLRNKWGFDGHFVSDCWAIRDIHENHKVTNTPAESAAMALKAGCDLNCGVTYLCLLAALKEKKITEEELRVSCTRLMATRMKLGILPRQSESANKITAKYDAIDYLQNDTDEHRALSLKAAQKSIVLLENDGTLPIKSADYPVIGVVGPTADLRTVLEGNYNGTSSDYVTNLQGIRRSTTSRLLFSEGCHLYQDRISNLALADDRMAEARTVVKNSDITILCMGLDATIEGEEGDTGNMFASGDKIDLNFPESQRILYDNVVKTAKKYGKKVIVVVNTGSAMDLSYMKNDVNAVLECWYSGGQGGQALADVLFGKVSPSGKLPVTFYKNDQLKDFRDYSMKDRTYRYLKEEPVYPFGYGLSYSSFEYSDVEAKIVGTPSYSLDNYADTIKPLVNVTLNLKNTGSMDADEVVMVYIDKEASEKKASDRACDKDLLAKLDPDNQPIKSLCAFKRVSLKAGESISLTVPVTSRSFTTVLEDGQRVLLRGDYTLCVKNASMKVTIE